MAYTSDGAPAATLIATKNAEKIAGINDEQKRLIAIAMARDGLTYAQAVAKYAGQASAAATGAHQAAITADAATKTAKNPKYAELVR